MKLAEERERRIQEEIKNTKQKNDDLLGATKAEEAIAPNVFFAARAPSKVISLVSEEYPLNDAEFTAWEVSCLVISNFMLFSSYSPIVFGEDLFAIAESYHRVATKR